MDFDITMASLMAVAASVAANCQPCFETTAAKALRCGADPRQIADAAEIGKKVRTGAAAKMDAFLVARESTAPAGARAESRKGCC